MELIESILPRALRRLGGTSKVRQARAEAAFARACGDFLRPHVRVVAVEGSVLVVACAHPAVAHQLQMDSAVLLEAVNAELGERRVTRMRFLPESGSAPGRAQIS